MPPNALVVVPLSAPSPELLADLAKGPVVTTPEQMWKLLGFNGPPVQVQDDQGRPVSVGLVDAGVTVSFAWSASGLVLGSRRLPEHVDLTRRDLASVLFGPHPERPVDRPRALDWLPAFHLPIPILDRS